MIPESVCGRCQGANPVWTAPSPLWNQVMRGGDINGTELHGGIVCPSCFAALAEEAGIASLWRFDADSVHVELQTVTPAGRVWNDETWLFDDPPSAVTVGAGSPDDALRTLREQARHLGPWRGAGADEAVEVLAAELARLTHERDMAQKLVENNSVARWKSIETQRSQRLERELADARAETKSTEGRLAWARLVIDAGNRENDRLVRERDVFRGLAEQRAEALRQIRDTAKWYGEGERLQHEVHHALVVEVYSVADNALGSET